MNIKFRLDKLEQRNAGFILAQAIYLDCDGQEIPWNDDTRSYGKDEDAIQASRIVTSADGEHTVDRLINESYAEFEKRAHREAGEELNVTVFAHPSTFKL